MHRRWARSTASRKSQLGLDVLFVRGCPRGFSSNLPTHRRPAVHRCPCAPFPTPSSTRFSSSQVRLPSLLRLAEKWNEASARCGFGASGEGGRDRVGRPIARGRGPPADFFGNDHVCCAGIGLLLSSALPNQITQMPPTSSMATSAALNRGPASSVMYIFPYAIVAAALSRLAGPSALAPPLARELE